MHASVSTFPVTRLVHYHNTHHATPHIVHHTSHTYKLQTTYST